jgi:hypothetical protein
MFVRWQQYRSQALNPWQRECNDRSARLKAILVESARVNGKPRQRHIAFLGSIELDDRRMITGDSDYARFERRMSTIRKMHFWRDVLSRLKQLGDNRVRPEDHELIVASIATKVGPPPTEAELDRFKRENERLLAQLLFRPPHPQPPADALIDCRAEAMPCVAFFRFSPETPIIEGPETRPELSPGCGP